MVPHQSASDSKQRDKLVQDCSEKDGDEFMLYQPVFASTPNQECPNRHIQGPQDDRLDHDSEIIFKGSDASLLLGDTMVDDIQHAT